MNQKVQRLVSILGGIGILTLQTQPAFAASIGDETAIPRHLQDGEEFQIPLPELLAYGKKLFAATWTEQDGRGRPLTKGTGAPLSDPLDPLVFPRNFNRISAPDSNACSGCHNAPFGPGGGGDIVGNVFVLGQRFDFATFDPDSTIATKSCVDEGGMLNTLQSIANSRATIGMFGSGYIELLAREMTADLQSTRDTTEPGETKSLQTKGVPFGSLRRNQDGSWDTSNVTGLSALSLKTTGADDPPSLIIRPFHQVGAVVSLREFSNNAFNHHHGMQSTERFGTNTDPDGDGVFNELTRADMTAISLFQAVMAVPGQVIPNQPEIEAAVAHGEELFTAIGCVECHRPSLPLNSTLYREPNPFNPPGNLQPGTAPDYVIDLTDHRLPTPRLEPDRAGQVQVPAFTDLKLHDLTDGPNDPNREALDQSQPAGSEAFFKGNGSFITKKLWGCANEPPFWHHGMFTTLRQSIHAHGGEAAATRTAFLNLSDYDQGSIIEFLKTLQVLPPGTQHLVVDEHGRNKSWHGRANRRQKTPLHHKS